MARKKDSFGPANDTARARIELRAAEMAFGEYAPRPCTDAEFAGWVAYTEGGDVPVGMTVRRMTQWQTGYLAREINFEAGNRRFWPVRMLPHHNNARRAENTLLRGQVAAGAVEGAGMSADVEVEAHSFNLDQIRNYLNALVWDQAPRLERWLIDYAGAPDTPYVRAVSRSVLVAAVRRVRQPGVKYDEMVILEGLQEAESSSALRILAVKDDWFTDDLPRGSDARRLMESTLGKWIVEVSELKGMGRSDVAAFKQWLSRQHDEARLAYDRKNTGVARQFVIVGTTNATDGYLRDATGNRRFWPVRIQRFDLDRLRADRDQLWAEAAEAEARGASIRLDPQLYGAAADDDVDVPVADDAADLAAEIEAADAAGALDFEGFKEEEEGSVYDVLDTPPLGDAVPAVEPEEEGSVYDVLDTPPLGDAVPAVEPEEEGSVYDVLDTPPLGDAVPAVEPEEYAAAELDPEVLDAAAVALFESGATEPESVEADPSFADAGTTCEGVAHSSPQWNADLDAMELKENGLPNSTV